MEKRELKQVRRIALALPEVNERFSHGALCFFIRDKIPVCYYHDDHRGDGRISLWCPVFHDLQEELVRNQPECFFKPQTSSAGHFRDWLGVYLDTSGENAVDWGQLSTILEDAFRKVAPKHLIAELDDRGPVAD
ncbi:MAG TPA: MmcQ/YjbR family DNA-binding protein [Steroidobacteraceae bacterium]